MNNACCSLGGRDKGTHVRSKHVNRVLLEMSALVEGQVFKDA